MTPRLPLMLSSGTGLYISTILREFSDASRFAEMLQEEWQVAN